MWTSRGRPKSACTTCKNQKIRCSGERPICKRCARLPRTCVYEPTKSAQQPLQFILDSRNSDRLTSPLENAAKDRNLQNHSDADNPVVDSRPLTSPPAMIPLRKNSPYLGISEPLMYTLVDVYFKSAYNASLLLHKGRFLKSLAEGTVEAHLILSVCAYAANFYRDRSGDAPLRDHGFMTEWAKRAGSLVFRDAEKLCEDNIVTFCILSTFWYSQGSWRLAYLHKANACNLFHIAGLSFVKHHMQSFLDTEIRRRRFWACYLMQCALMENPASFEPIANVSELPLPSSEIDFEVGVANGLPATLENCRSSASIHAELIRGFKLWFTVFALVKLPESSIGDRFSKIYAVDDALASWWSVVPSEYKLTPSTLPHVPVHQLPLTLLVNIIFHQSICALHASVVPLFSWTESNENWASARQASAQKTYEHAGVVSDLIAATLASHPKLNMTHSFLAYAAYSGCAVQIPFAWSSNVLIKTRATTNVGMNMKMIQLMAPYWKFAAVLQKQFGSLYKIHEKRAVDLDDEPKNINIRKLVDFKITATNARMSILGFTEILRSTGHGYANSGEESSDLGIQDQNDQTVLETTEYSSSRHETSTVAAPETDTNEPRFIHDRDANLSLAYFPEQPGQTLGLSLDQSDHDSLKQARTQVAGPSDLINYQDIDMQSYEMWPPFFHPTMLDVLSESDMLTLSQIDADSTDQYYLDPENWVNFSTT